MSINNYFDKIYIITMESNKERHQYIKKLFSENNIKNYKFVYGIEGKNINVDELVKNKQLDEEWLEKRPNVIGTILTHRDAWKDMIENNYNQCVFFEDDVYFLKRFKERFNDFMNHIPNDWSVLQFGYLPIKHKWSNTGNGNKCINPFVRKVNHTISGAHFYALNKRSSRILLENFYPIYKAVDGYMGDMTNTQCPKFTSKDKLLQAYTPHKCYAVDCSHDNGQDVHFKSNGIL